MKDSYMETITVSSDNVACEIRIKDFREATEPFYKKMKYIHSDKNFEFYFSAIFFPNRVDEDAVAWVAFHPVYTVHRDMAFKRDCMHLSCTMSIIDIEGNSRLPRYFRKLPHESNSGRGEYFRKSFILNRAKQFLPDGVLTLRLDFDFVLKELASFFDEGAGNRNCEMVCSMNTDQARDRNDIILEDMDDKLIVYDYTRRIPTLPQFHEAKKRFGVYGIPQEVSSFDSKSEEDSADFLEHVWMIDFEYARFLVPFDERRDSVGSRLLYASPVIRRMVGTDMREQRAKRITFANMRFGTFCLVLDFLRLGKFMVNNQEVKFYEVVEVYEFLHQYEMEELRRKCADHMAESFRHESEVKELEIIAHIYEDAYLSERLKLLGKEYEDLDQPLFRMDDVLYSDCYT